jgi:TPR repeat protein
LNIKQHGRHLWFFIVVVLTTAVTTLAQSGAADYVKQGNAYLEAGQSAKAIEAYKQAIRLKPDFADAYSNLGRAYIRTKRQAEALATYRALQKISQDEANSLYLEVLHAADLKAKNANKQPAEIRAMDYENPDFSTLLAKANQGDTAAMYRLADLYNEKGDRINSLKWILKGASLGDPEFQDELGLLYENGTGGAPKDVTQARRWFRTAAAQDLEEAYLHLCESYASELDLDRGVLPSRGKDAPESPNMAIQSNKAALDEAFRWCERGGDLGLTHAAWYAGVLNARGGPGHPPDFAEAYFWLSTGGRKADDAFRQEVGKHLTQAQRAALEKRAASFRPSFMDLYREQLMKARQRK